MARPKKTVHFGCDASRRIEPDTAGALARVDDGWVTMHGPKIEMRRRKGEENLRIAAAAMACGGGTGQLDESVADAAVDGLRPAAVADLPRAEASGRPLQATGSTVA